jgi:hypothetical protein
VPAFVDDERNPWRCKEEIGRGRQRLCESRRPQKPFRRIRTPRRLLRACAWGEVRAGRRDVLDGVWVCAVEKEDAGNCKWRREGDADAATRLRLHRRMEDE